MAVAMTLGTGYMRAQEQQQQNKPMAHVPAYRGLIEREQPNGYKLQTYLRGDEHKHWALTEDGWQIIENKKGWLVYATKNRKGETVASKKKAHNYEDRGRCEKRWLEKKGIQIEK